MYNGRCAAVGRRQKCVNCGGEDCSDPPSSSDGFPSQQNQLTERGVLHVPYLSAQEASALQGARLPQENENRQRPEGAFPPSCQGVNIKELDTKVSSAKDVVLKLLTQK